MTVKTYIEENDLCLLRMDKQFFIGTIDLPQKEWTIEQYNDWLYKATPNLISLNDKYVPQLIRHSGFIIEHTMGGCRKYYADKHSCGQDYFNSKFNFKDLLLDLLNLEKSQYINTFFKYFEQFYKETTPPTNTPTPPL